jgi:hypothetical protein
VFHQRFPQGMLERSPSSCRLPIVLTAAAILIATSMLFRTSMKDESQYVAAIALMPHGWLYRDFAYLQTPLQPLLLSPLALLPAGLVYAGARVANALFAFATLLVLSWGLRRHSAPHNAALALAALVCCHPFLFAASLARNDALPMVLIGSAVAALLVALQGRSLKLFAAAGLFLGLATSAKISAALPAAGVVLFLVMRIRTFGISSLAALGVGAFAGLLPCVVFAVVSPAEFHFDVFTYSLSAPVQWWTSVGESARLEPRHRIVSLIGLATQGSILIAIAAALFDRKRSDDRLLLDLMIAGGIVGSYLPEPAYPQYLVPLLPPLFARFALALDAAPLRRRKALLILTGIGSIAGLGFAGSHLRAGIPIAEAAQVGPRAAALAKGGDIVSLSPEFFAGAGAEIDPRFAAGPFLFRTTDGLGEQAARLGHSVSRQDVAQAFEREPPAVFIAGGEKERRRPGRRYGLDAPIVSWARFKHYRPVALGRGFVAYVRS